MRNLIVLVAALLVSLSASAQKYAVVNTETIFKAMSEYRNAISQIDELAKTEQASIDGKYDKIAEMYDRYQQQKENLSSLARKQVEDNIIALEKEAEQQQKKYFGSDGEIMKKRVALLKPIQERVFARLDELSKSKGYDLVLDIANNPTVVYYNKSVDITDELMRMLGISK